MPQTTVYIQNARLKYSKTKVPMIVLYIADAKTGELLFNTEKYIPNVIASPKNISELLVKINYVTLARNFNDFLKENHNEELIPDLVGITFNIDLEKALVQSQKVHTFKSDFIDHIEGEMNYDFLKYAPTKTKYQKLAKKQFIENGNEGLYLAARVDNKFQELDNETSLKILKAQLQNIKTNNPNSIFNLLNRKLGQKRIEQQISIKSKILQFEKSKLN